MRTRSMRAPILTRGIIRSVWLLKAAPSPGAAAAVQVPTQCMLSLMAFDASLSGAMLRGIPVREVRHGGVPDAHRLQEAYPRRAAGRRGVRLRRSSRHSRGHRGARVRRGGRPPLAGRGGGAAHFDGKQALHLRHSKYIVHAGLHARMEFNFLEPIRLGMRVRTRGKVIDKFERRGKPYMVTEYVTED